MKNDRLARHRLRRRRRQFVFKLTLLMLPAMFWSIVFATLAGVRLPGRVADGVPDVAQALIALACPLLAAMLCVATLRRETSKTGNVISPGHQR